MIAYLKTKKVTNEIRIVSNGLLLNPKLNQELVDAGVDLVRISVEAMTSEQYKEICGADVDIDKFLENFADLFHRTRGKARISAKITNATFYKKEDFDKFFDMFDKITDFMMVQNVAGTWSEFEEMKMPDSALPARFNGNVVTETQVLCSYPLTSMMIHSNGIVGMCPQDWKFLTQYGVIKEKSLKEIWASKYLRNIQIMHMEGRKKEIEFCKNCICIGDDHPDAVGHTIAQKLREVE
jgi:radical SAM protein with 4Fe4S-binding SPASM domain